MQHGQVQVRPMKLEVLFPSTPQQPHQEQRDTNIGLRGPSFQPGLPLLTPEFSENRVAFLTVSLLS